MDFSRIKLENERNSHVTKRLNRLNTWQFFKVIYRENIWRMFGYNFLMILCIVPIIIVIILGGIGNSEIEQTLPMLNSMGFSTGAWLNLDNYLADRIYDNNIFYGLMTVVSSLLVTLIFSGGFAVIRDAFWTGKLSAVGVLKSVGKGIKSNILYAFVANVVIAFSVFGIYAMYLTLSTQILWLAIVLAVVLGIIALFVMMYLMILCSVSVTYKQSLRQNLEDSWRLMWLNVLPNLIHLLLALAPIALYILFSGGLLQQLLLIVILMFGGLYFPLVWHTHMMKTFALFHPVEVRKKKQTKHPTDVADEQDQGGKEKSGKPGKNGKAKGGTSVVDEATTDESAQPTNDTNGNTSDSSSIADSENDAYALDDDAYVTDDEHKD